MQSKPPKVILIINSDENKDHSKNLLDEFNRQDELNRFPWNNCVVDFSLLGQNMKRYVHTTIGKPRKLLRARTRWIY
jgi:hypothetical protein